MSLTSPRHLQKMLCEISLFFRLLCPKFMEFTDDQMLKAISSNDDVKTCYKKIIEACLELKTNTGCPDDDVDRFLRFLIGKWK